MANGFFGGGDGTVYSPFLVEDAADLDAVRNSVSSHYKQVQDIDLSHIELWIPIGKSQIDAFEGTYNGGYKNIDNLTINLTDATGSENDEQGIFGYALKGSVLANVNLSDVSIINGGVAVGALVGRSLGSIKDCSMSGNVEGYSAVGGLVGEYNGDVLFNCHAVANVNGYTQVGVIAGLSFRLEKCSAIGTVVAKSSGAGGLCGSASKGMENCYADVNVTGIYGGGLAGTLAGEPSRNCYAKGIVSGSYPGSLVGSLYAPLSASYALSGQSLKVAGYNTPGGVLSDCYQLTDLVTPQAGIITPKQAMTHAHYENNGWDFDTIWDIHEGESYPFFKIPVQRAQCKAIPLMRMMTNFMKPRI